MTNDILKESKELIHHLQIHYHHQRVAAMIQKLVKIIKMMQMLNLSNHLKCQYQYMKMIYCMKMGEAQVSFKGHVNKLLLMIPKMIEKESSN